MVRSAIDEFLARLQARAKGPLGRTRRSAEDVAAAEAALGVKLPPSYHNLVTSVGPADFDWVYWPGNELPPGLDLVRINTRALWPEFLVAVCGDGGGDEACFDTRFRDPSGEYPIVRWNHETNDEHSTEFKGLAPDLGTFLLILLN